VRNGVKLVAATLNGHEDFDDHTALLDYGFKTIRPQLLFSSPPYLPLKVLFGEAKSVSCGCDLSLTASLSDAELTRLRTEVLMPEFVYAPVCEGKKVGTLVFRLDGVTVAEADIRAEDTVDLKRPQPGLAERFLNLFQ
jgi:D-alanyl-D-alanine carboxypeptidase (penicillin-binding protein 5/6)